MHTYIIRRLLLMFPTLIGITLVVFAVMAAAPGGISAQSLVEGQNLQPQVKKAMEEYYNHRYGLDQPAPVQYLRWLNNVSPIGFTFDKENNIEGFSLTKGSDLGTSFRYGRSVLDLIEERLPLTLLLNVLSIPLIYIIAIAIGVHAATQRGKPFDIGSGISMLALWSVPTMLAGVLLIGFFASDKNWHWFPTAGLSRREALDMQFLPHWSFAGDVILLFFAVALVVALFIALSSYGSRWLRTTLMALLGGWLGFVMVGALPGDGALLTYILLMALLAALCGLIAYSDYHALRTGMMGLMGLSGEASAPKGEHSAHRVAARSGRSTDRPARSTPRPADAGSGPRAAVLPPDLATARRGPSRDRRRQAAAAVAPRGRHGTCPAHRPPSRESPGATTAALRSGPALATVRPAERRVRSGSKARCNWRVRRHAAGARRPPRRRASPR